MIRRSFVRSAALGVALAALSAAPLVAQANGTTVYLVRHAEKATTPAADPPLTSAGEARARALATLLADSGVTAVITTELARTKETAQPLAAARALAPVAIAVRGSTATHVTAVVDAVRRHAGGIVLVVGHSNTIPLIIEALGGPAMPAICDAAYSNLFVMRLVTGSPANVTRVTYGAADPDGSDACAGLKP